MSKPWGRFFQIMCAYQKVRTLKFMFSEKATKIEEIFTVNLTLCSKCQIDGEDFVNFCGLLRKHELYSTQLPILSPLIVSSIKGITKNKSRFYM